LESYRGMTFYLELAEGQSVPLESIQKERLLRKDFPEEFFINEHSLAARKIRLLTSAAIRVVGFARIEINKFLANRVSRIKPGFHGHGRIARSLVKGE
jgi:hypothetical protein